MKLDQFGMSGLGALFKNLNQPAQTVMPAVNGGGGENIAVGLGGGSLTPSLPTGSGSGATSSGSGSGATASPTTAKPTALSGIEDAQMKSYSPAMPFPGLPNPFPSPSPLSGLEFFLQNLAMQDQASASQDKIKGLMSGIQTLISNEFPNANFEGGGDSSINRLTTIMGKY